jgi:hypothetical protein
LDLRSINKIISSTLKCKYCHDFVITQTFVTFSIQCIRWFLLPQRQHFKYKLSSPVAFFVDGKRRIWNNTEKIGNRCIGRMSTIHVFVASFRSTHQQLRKSFCYIRFRHFIGCLDNAWSCKDRRRCEKFITCWSPMFLRKRRKLEVFQSLHEKELRSWMS